MGHPGWGDSGCAGQGHRPQVVNTWDESRGDVEPWGTDPSAGQGSGTLLAPLPQAAPSRCSGPGAAPTGVAQPRAGGQTRHKDRFISPAFIPADSVGSFTFIQGTQWQGEYKINSKKGVGVRGQLGAGVAAAASPPPPPSPPPRCRLLLGRLLGLALHGDGDGDFGRLDGRFGQGGLHRQHSIGRQRGPHGRGFHTRGKAARRERGEGR